jgi:hypothetical protein
MQKSYSVNGVVYNFTNVHEECGMLVGECTTRPHWGQLAWLDDHGVQFFGESRVEAQEVIESTLVDNSYTMWGGQLRDKLPHGARYYQRGRR